MAIVNVESIVEVVVGCGVVGGEVMVEFEFEVGCSVEFEVVVEGESVVKCVWEKNKKEGKMSKTIEVSEETYEKIKTQLGTEVFEEIQDYKGMVGQKYFFRTVTYHLVGKVERIVGDFVQLSTASWIADSGRFMNFIQDGKLDEVEPVGIAYVNIKAVTDFFPWKHPLPTKQQ